jgi:3-methylcrotonyl-CoA carboxylase alpha subunit
MEMNTRLQVEHPVTEMITGLDLVQLQLEVASGNPLPLAQDEVQCIGHAFEARIYAENPRNNFLPDAGTLAHHVPPQVSDTVRVDSGVERGANIGVFYDPLIAKVIAHGVDREDALRRLRVALSQYQIVGPSTNVEFLGSLASHKAFIGAELDTGFIEVRYPCCSPSDPLSSPTEVPR